MFLDNAHVVIKNWAWCSYRFLAIGDKKLDMYYIMAMRDD